MSILLCDVGGTHVRFSLGSRLQPYKTRVDQHPTLSHAIKSYLQAQSVPAQDIDKFYFAFSNRNEWNTSAEELRLALPNAKIAQVNDFEANAHGVLAGSAEDFVVLKAADGDRVEKASSVVIGVGTGLGFAYICGPDDRRFVQRSHGAHMLPAYSKTHSDLYEFISKDKADALIYEDMLTGRGLFEIYKFISQRNHLDLEYPDIEILMRDGKDNPVFQESLTIFFELLGLFTHQAVAFGYSYNGVYLTGGVIDRLMLAGLFSIEKFLLSFNQVLHPIVVKDVSATPIFWVKDEFISLKGLLYLAGEKHA